MYHPFSVAETVKTSWEIMKKNFVTIIVYSFISFVLLSILGVIITLIISPEQFTGTMIVSLLLLFVQAYTTLGLYKLIFTLIDSEYYEFALSQVFPSFKMIISYLAVVFIIAFVITNYGILIDKLNYNPLLETIAGAVGVIIGLYFALRIMFFNTFIVDDHSGPIESIRQSFKLTKGYILKIALMLIIVLLLIALPAELFSILPAHLHNHYFHLSFCKHHTRGYLP